MGRTTQEAAVAQAKARRSFAESRSRFAFFIAHDLFGKPVSTFPDHAPITRSFIVLRFNNPLRQRGFWATEACGDAQAQAVERPECAGQRLIDLLVGQPRRSPAIDDGVEQPDR